MATLMYSSSSGTAGGDGFRIAYEELDELAQDYLRLFEVIDAADRDAIDAAGGGALAELYDTLGACLGSLNAASKLRIMNGPMLRGVQSAVEAGRRARRISNALSTAAGCCRECERDVDRLNYGAEGNQAVRSGSFDGLGHAAGFYAAVAEAEEAQRRAEEEAAATAAAAAAAAAAAEAKREEMLAFLAQYFPDTYADYMQRLHEAEEAEWLEYLKENDPAMYEMVMAEKKRQEAARKAAEEAAAALEAELAEAGAELGGGLGGSDLGGSDWSSDLGLGDSGFGGGGGFGGADLGSVDDWAADLLADTIDGAELGAAGEALDGFATAATELATSVGREAVAGAELAAQGGGLLAQYGDQLASFAHAYGLQAAAALGGAAVLYATREQTTEAVAYAAEFVQTKCKPFASDVVDQVKGAAKKTRVDLANTKSRVVGVARGERAGDLVG